MCVVCLFCNRKENKNEIKRDLASERLTIPYTRSLLILFNLKCVYPSTYIPINGAMDTAGGESTQTDVKIFIVLLFTYQFIQRTHVWLQINNYNILYHRIM